MGIFDRDEPQAVPAPAPEKPLLFSDTRSDAEKFDPRLHRGHLDPSRIPGYSEIVMANDIAKADALFFREKNGGITQEDMYQRIGAKPQELEVELQWLPVSGAGGAPSESQARALDRYRTQEGFRLLQIEELRAFPWYTSDPPLGRVAEDGTIRRGVDVALFVRSGEVARNWEAFKVEESRRLEGVSLEVDSVAPGANLSHQETERVTVTH